MYKGSKTITNICNCPDNHHVVSCMVAEIADIYAFYTTKINIS